MTTTQKFRNFVQEPMGNKEVTQLAGIGCVLGEKLQRIGFNKAYTVLGQFLILKKSEELFKDWLKETIHANEKQAGDCCRCLKEWCDNYL